MPLSMAVTEALYSAYNEDQPLEAMLHGAFKLVDYGYVDNAREVLEGLKERDAFGKGVLRLQRSCERTSIYDKESHDGLNGVESVTVDGLAGPIKVRPPTDVMIIRAGPQVKQVLIAFGGAREAFWLPPQFFELTNCHVVVIRDARRLFHMVGVEGLGATYEESVEGLRQIVSDLGATKVFMTGNSSGGYAALRYALDFGDVRGVLVISPVTGGNLVKEAVEHPALRPILRTKPEMMLDTLTLYQEHPNPPKVTIAWGEGHAKDSEQSTRMGVLPNVKLEPLRGVSQHPVPFQLVLRPGFDLLKRLLAM